MVKAPLAKERSDVRDPSPAQIDESTSGDVAEMFESGVEVSPDPTLAVLNEKHFSAELDERGGRTLLGPVRG
jgi:hypothetical protein